MITYICYTKEQELIDNIFNYIETLVNELPVLYNISLINMNGHSDVSHEAICFQLSDNVVINTSEISRTFKTQIRKLDGNNFLTISYTPHSQDVIGMKSRVKALITSKANELRYVTIAYDGKNLDANEIAQTNISGKIAQLQNELALALPSNDLFWKDADNIVHTWTDPAVYLEWLQGLQVQIASRATSLYNTAWTGKAAVDALTTIDEVSNYDIDALFGIV